MTICMCESLKKKTYPRPSDVRFVVSGCDRRDKEQLSTAVLQQNCFESGGFVLNVSLEDRNTIAPDFQYDLRVMFSLQISMSSADTNPLPYFIPALLTMTIYLPYTSMTVRLI